MGEKISKRQAAADAAAMVAEILASQAVSASALSGCRLIGELCSDGIQAFSERPDANADDMRMIEVYRSMRGMSLAGMIDFCVELGIGARVYVHGADVYTEGTEVATISWNGRVALL